MLESNRMDLLFRTIEAGLELGTMGAGLALGQAWGLRQKEWALRLGMQGFSSSGVELEPGALDSSWCCGISGSWVCGG